MAEDWAEALEPCLPSLADTDVLPRTCVLDIISSIDASRPVNEQHDQKAAGTSRLLRLQLADARGTQCGAFEYRPLGSVPCLGPGARVRVGQGTRVAGGMLLLTPEATSWSGSPSPSAAAPAAEADGPPRFKPFVPPASGAPSPATAARQPPPPSSVPPASQAPAPAAPAPAAAAVRPPPRPSPTPAAVSRASPATSKPTRAAAPPAPQAPPTVPTAPALDPGLVADLLDSGLTLAEVYATYGLPPPPSASGPASSGVSSGGGQCGARSAGSKGKGGGGKGRTRLQGY